MEYIIFSYCLLFSTANTFFLERGHYMIIYIGAYLLHIQLGIYYYITF